LPPFLPFFSFLVNVGTCSLFPNRSPKTKVPSNRVGACPPLSVAGAFFFLGLCRKKVAAFFWEIGALLPPLLPLFFPSSPPFCQPQLACFSPIFPLFGGDAKIIIDRAYMADSTLFLLFSFPPHRKNSSLSFLSLRLNIAAAFFFAAADYVSGPPPPWERSRSTFCFSFPATRSSGPFFELQAHAPPPAPPLFLPPSDKRSVFPRLPHCFRTALSMHLRSPAPPVEVLSGPPFFPLFFPTAQLGASFFLFCFFFFFSP